MIIFINNKSTKFRQLTLRITRFIHKRKVVPFSPAHDVHCLRCTRRHLADVSTWSVAINPSHPIDSKPTTNKLVVTNIILVCDDLFSKCLNVS